MLEINRRSLITGLVSFIAAPAIVRVSSIMPVRVMLAEAMLTATEVTELQEAYTAQSVISWRIVSLGKLRMVETP